MKNKGYAFRSNKGEMSVRFDPADKLQAGNIFTLSFADLHSFLCRPGKKEKGMEGIRGMRIKEDGIHVYRGHMNEEVFTKKFNFAKDFRPHKSKLFEFKGKGKTHKKAVAVLA